MNVFFAIVVCILASFQNASLAIAAMVIFQAHRIYTYGVAAAYLQATFAQVNLFKVKTLYNLEFEAILRVTDGPWTVGDWVDVADQFADHCRRRKRHNHFCPRFHWLCCRLDSDAMLANNEFAQSNGEFVINCVLICLCVSVAVGSVVICR